MINIIDIKHYIIRILSKELKGLNTLLKRLIINSLNYYKIMLL
jgi:hypothetical protein